MKDLIVKSLGFIRSKLQANIKVKLDIIKFIIGYIIFVFTLFLVGWGYLWFIKGIPDLLLLLKGIETLTAPAVLSAIKFVTDKVSETIIDKNNNGIDDRLEKVFKNE